MRALGGGQCVREATGVVQLYTSSTAARLDPLRDIVLDVLWISSLRSALQHALMDDFARTFSSSAEEKLQPPAFLTRRWHLL